MHKGMLPYVALSLISVFVGAVSQVLLKKSAQKDYPSPLAEYLNPPVIFAYTLFVGSSLLSVLAYRGIPLSMGPILEATGYFYVTFFGVTIFHEKLNSRKLLGLAVIIAGIAVYSLGLS